MRFSGRWGGSISIASMPSLIVDGDSLVTAEFLHQLNLQLERGDRVIQCYNGVANSQARAGSPA